MIEFELPQNNESIIKVIGVGGGGGNAVNHMYSLGIDDVDFILCNTDMKALSQSPVPTKVQLGPQLTKGLGAGAKPEVGRDASEESLEEIKKAFGENTQMVFVTAGMGGGTGTGAAPIVAKLAKESGALTVGIVTTPFSYEGRKRKLYAEEGIKELQENVDTLLVISNDKVRQHFGNVAISEAFAKADDILATAAKCITDVISSKGHIVVDFADVCTVMRDGGSAILGSANASGEDRAAVAVQEALSSPLLNDRDIKGAQWILLNVNSSQGEHEHTLDEMEMIQAFVQDQAGEDCDLILGMGYDEDLGDEISITVIATGFKTNDTKTSFTDLQKEKNKVVVALDTPAAAAPSEDEVRQERNKAAANRAGGIVEKLDMTPTSFEMEEPAIPQASAVKHGFGGLRTETPSLNEEKEILELSSDFVQEEAISHEPLLEEMTMDLRETEDQLENEMEEVSETISVSNVDSEVTQAENQSEEKVEEEFIVFDKEAEGDEILFEVTNPTAVKEEITEEVTNKEVEETLQPEIETSVLMNEDADFVTINGITLSRKKGDRILSDYELEQEANFELQKRAFDERASKLRSLSFNPNQSDELQEDEEVPAFERKNVDLEEHLGSEDEHISGTQVSDKKNSLDSNISTLNNFLNGDYPD
jgi:cell division protein FtsZ